MANALAAPWLEQLRPLCAATGQPHVDLLLDPAGLPTPLLPAVQRMHPAVPWYSLFAGTPEAPLINHAPLLLRLNLDSAEHCHRLGEMLAYLNCTYRLLALVSPLRFDELGQQLRARSQLRWGGQQGLLRYFDARVWPTLLTHVLTPAQREHLLAPAHIWGWQNRDRRLCWLEGTPQALQPGEAGLQPLSISDEQFFRLGCIADAEALAQKLPLLGGPVSREHLFDQAFSHALAAAEAGYFGPLRVYVQRLLAGDPWVPRDTARQEGSA